MGTHTLFCISYHILDFNKVLIFYVCMYSNIVVMLSSLNGPRSRISRGITVGIRATVHMHEVLLDTHAKSPDLTANLSVYVMNIMLKLMF